MTAQVNGQVNGANAARLFIKYSNGTIVNVWQNTSTFNGSQSVSGSFTTPATVASFQVGTAVMLDKGYLDFSEVTLTAYSNALPITAGGTYQFTGQVAGALAAPLGQGGRIVAAYTNVDGQSAGEDLLWQNPTNFNGTVPVQQTFTANAGAVTLRLALTAVLDAGHLGFGDVNLQHLTAGDVIRRSTYMLAGQAVAVRVSGDPDGNDGLHYLYSDHLGSASAMRKDDGSAPIITRYTPFGSYRGGSGPNAVTDRGFTGQPENMDLGLYYYQARFYVPGIGRFASADTIVPDPARPQSYNRYSYVENRPLKFIDPTGHCNIDPYDDYHDYGCLVEAHSLANAYGVSFDILAKYWVFGASTPEALGAIWAAFMSSIPQLANPNPLSGDALAAPETVAELMTMMGIAQDIADIAQRLFDTSGAFRADCHHVCAAYTGQTFDEFDETAAWWANIYYELGEISGAITLSRRTEVVYAFERDEDNILPSSSWAVTYGGKHSALMVSFDANDPANSIVVQVNGSVDASGVYFTRIKDTVFFQRYRYIGIPE